jgi:hypothetical protein
MEELKEMVRLKLMICISEKPDQIEFRYLENYLKNQIENSVDINLPSNVASAK